MTESVTPSYRLSPANLLGVSQATIDASTVRREVCTETSAGFDRRSRAASPNFPIQLSAVVGIERADGAYAQQKELPITAGQ
jgi:hypothetical protein